MSVNTSSFSDIPLLPPGLTYANTSSHPVMNTCFRSKEILVLFTAFSSVIFLFLPLFIFILYLGFQQWRQQRNRAALSHSDVFLYHSIAIQLLFFLGYILFFCGGYIYQPKINVVAQGFLRITTFGQALFQLLTCVERYLAVTKPITYRGLRQTNGIRIRNISIGCVWILCLLNLIVYYFGSSDLNLILFFCITGFILTVISFCSISVLCTLMRPGPGEGSINRERVDESKQRAFYTIIAISGVLSVRFGCYIIGTFTYNSSVLNPTKACVVMFCIVWFDLPSSLLLPMLFLQRAGKLYCCKQSTKSG